MKGMVVVMFDDEGAGDAVEGMQALQKHLFPFKSFIITEDEPNPVTGSLTFKHVESHLTFRESRRVTG